MKLWRLPITDGLLDKHEGTAVAWADDAEGARRAVEQELSDESAYGKPFVVGDATDYDEEHPHVVVVNWGD